jgi:hypothetical protein
MMALRLALVLAGAFAVSMLMPEPAEAVCRPHCLDLNKTKRGDARGLDRADAMAGEHGHHGRHNEHGRRGHHGDGEHDNGHDGRGHGNGHHGDSGGVVPPVTPPVVTPPVTPPPVEPVPCIGC